MLNRVRYHTLFDQIGVHTRPRHKYTIGYVKEVIAESPPRRGPSSAAAQSRYACTNIESLDIELKSEELGAIHSTVPFD
ncbi:hypothetical protein PG994_013452 [Apiospora phragmitis]|uniref:Uncharacterized protein n=1 Tax=Apiospora phragmitis TaxID=2905665 RepID=A0ABR1T8P7_9PEZI